MAEGIVRKCPTCGEQFISKTTLKCKPCAKAYNAAWYAANRERVAARVKSQRSTDPEKYRAMSERWRKANPDKVKAKSAQWYAANRDKSIEKSKAWQRANPEKVRERNLAAYRNRDPKKCNAAHREWTAKNSDKVRAWRQAWAERNPERLRLQKLNYKIRKRASGGRLSGNIITRLMELQRGLCACCRKPLGERYHLDHIVPLSIGGEHADRNMQLLRDKCNMQKSNKDPIEFMRSRGFLL